MEHFVSPDGTRIAYEKSGSGSPLILVHGMWTDHTRWAPVLPALEQHFTVYAMDRRGRGGSGDTDPYAIEREFEDIATLVESIGEPVDVLGHSLGAYLALEAARNTSRLRKLVLYEPPLPGQKDLLPPEAEAKMEALLASGDRAGLVSTFFSEVAKATPEEVEELRTLPSWDMRLATAHTIVRELKGMEGLPPFASSKYSGLEQPLLLLVGSGSPIENREVSRQLHEDLPTSRLVVLPGQGHVAINSAPDLFVREVVGFLG